MWFYVALAVLGFAWMVATSHGEEPRTRAAGTPKPTLVLISASWCDPCKSQKTHTVPALIERGYGVLNYDLDAPNVRRLFNPPSVPAWYLISEPIHATSADEVLERFCLDVQPRADPVAASALTDAKPKPATDLVAQLRRFLGTTKPRSHSSLAWSFEEPATIELDPKTKVTRPRLLAAEVDFQDGQVVVTFGHPLPQAHVVKAGATLSVDVPRVTIKGNVVTATADLAFGLQKDFEIVITRSPFDE